MKEKEASKQDLLTKEQELLCQKIKLAPKTYIYEYIDYENFSFDNLL